MGVLGKWFRFIKGQILKAMLVNQRLQPKRLNQFIIGTFLENSLANLDLSDATLFRVSLLLKTFEAPAEDLEPTQDMDEDNMAEQNATFFLYIIKDVLTHFGFLPSTSPHRELQTSLFKFDLLTAKSQEFTKVLAQLEQ